MTEPLVHFLRGAVGVPLEERLTPCGQLLMRGGQPAVLVVTDPTEARRVTCPDCRRRLGLTVVEGSPSCPTPGCEGDPRYAAPGRRHREGCRYPLNDALCTRACTPDAPDPGCPVHGDEREALARFLRPHAWEGPIDGVRWLYAKEQEAAQQEAYRAADVFLTSDWMRAHDARVTTGRQALQDLADRLQRGIRSLEEVTQTVSGVYDTARLTGKRQGVELALSWVEEALR